MAQPVETATDQMRNHFERPLRWTLYNFFKSVPDLCFIGLFAVLGKAKYHYRRTDRWTDGQTDGRYQRYNLPCFAVDKYVSTHVYR